jgi:peptide-methionine (S)-S-oxide reductase
MPMFSLHSPKMPTSAEALPGRAEAMPVPPAHHVNDRSLVPPYPDGLEIAEFALGCFWGEEKLFWQVPGVWVTAVGYQGGYTPNPTYREVCTGKTGHAETVRVVFDPTKVTYDELLRRFWEAHDPTQGMRQGNDVGTQYRSGIYTRNAEQERVAREVLAEVNEHHKGRAVTELLPEANYSRAEDYHQHYFANHPNQGYCAAVVAPKVEKFKKTFASRLRG